MALRELPGGVGSSNGRRVALVSLEVLEGRRLLSGGAWFAGHPLSSETVVTAPASSAVAAPHKKARTAATSVSFPTAPFHGSSEFTQGTFVYVNQFGDALLKHVPVGGAGQGQYDLYFDDPGNVSVSVDGTVPLDLGFYNQTSKPSQVDTRGLTSGVSVSASVDSTKAVEYVAVQPHVPGQTGLANVHVNGIAVTGPGWDSFAVSPSTNTGWGHTSISGSGDFDFWRITVPTSGNWLFAVHPLSGLDSSMTVFNTKGSPIGGTFTQPINNPGVGNIETFSESLTAGQQAIVRVDGVGKSTGWYIISAKLISQPSVSVAATATPAHAGSGSPGQFRVSSSVAGKRAIGVPYTLSGTAVNGVDYQALSGTAWIPAGQFSTTVTVQPLGSGAANKNVVLTLASDPKYQLGSPTSATVTIAQ